MRAWLIVVCFVCITAGVAGVVGTKTTASIAAENDGETGFKVQAVKDNVWLTMSVDNNKFQLGENVAIKIEIKNGRTDNIFLPGWGWDDYFKLVVYDENKEELGIWPTPMCKMMDGEVYPCEVCICQPTTRVEPVKSHELILVWDQKAYVIDNSCWMDNSCYMPPLHWCYTEKALELGIYYVQGNAYAYTDNGYVTLQTSLLEIEIQA